MNIVRLLNVVQEGESILILVWELVKGKDVLDYLNDHGGGVAVVVRGGPVAVVTGPPAAVFVFVLLVCNT